METRFGHHVKDESNEYGGMTFVEVALTVKLYSKIINEAIMLQRLYNELSITLYRYIEP